LAFILAFILAPILTLILILFLNPAIKFLNRVSDGKAIGSLGLTLSFVGIAIEAIQVWVIPQKIYLMFVIVVTVILTYLIIKKS